MNTQNRIRRHKRKRRRFIPVLMLPILLVLLGLMFVGSDWMGRIAHPIQYQNEIRQYARAYEVDPFLIAAIIKVESNFDPRAVSRKGALGIMQLMPDTAKWILTKGDFGSVSVADTGRDPEAGIRLGAWYVKELSRQFEGDTVKLVAAYNAGPGKVRQWLNEGVWDGSSGSIGDIPYGETRHYVQRVLYYYKKYAKLYEEL